MNNPKSLPSQEKKCWKCRRPVEINKYGYGFCPANNHDDSQGAYVITDSRHYVRIQSDGSEVML